TSGAFRVAVDAKRNIYYGVSQAAMYEVKNPYRQPAIKLPEQVTEPFSESFARSGYMLVADYERNGSGELMLFAPGASSPVTTLENGNRPYVVVFNNDSSLIF